MCTDGIYNLRLENLSALGESLISGLNEDARFLHNLPQFMGTLKLWNLYSARVHLGLLKNHELKITDRGSMQSMHPESARDLTAERKMQITSLMFLKSLE